MDCRTFEDRLERLLDGALSPAEEREVAEHLASCEACGHLERMLRGDDDAPAREDVDLTGPVLARTTGSPCERARGLLSSRADAAMEALDSELLRGHLGHCQDCRAVEIALARLAEDLPSLALAEPDARFTGDVLAATLPLAARLRRGARGARETWSQWMQRPRFAWEAAYVGAILLGILFWTPGSPLKEVPAQAIALAQVNPLHALRESPLAAVPATVSTWSRQAWDAAGAPVVQSGRDLGVALSRRLKGAGNASEDLFRHAAQVGQALWSGDLEASKQRLKSIGGDLLSIWNHLVAPPVMEEDEDNDEHQSREA